MFDNVFQFFEIRFNGVSSKIFKALENIALKKESPDNTLRVKDVYKNLDFKQLIKDREFWFDYLKREVGKVSNLKDILLIFERKSSLDKNLQKNYLRNTMGQERPNDVALISTYKYLARDLDIDVLVSKFISINSSRKKSICVKII